MTKRKRLFVTTIYNQPNCHRNGSSSRLAPLSLVLRPAVFLGAVCVASLSGCNKETGSSTASDEQSTSAASASKTTAAVKEADRKHPIVRIETSQGTMAVRLDAVRAPGTVRNFLNYAGEGFYDNTIIHYVDPGEMILAGGYSAEHQAKPPRLPIRNEAHNGLKNTRGTIAMARDQSLIDNATSQFFINLADAPQRDHAGDTAEKYGYCVFGEVIEGLDIAEQISQSPTTDLGGDLVKTPEPRVVIKSIRVVR